ncbi:MAG: ATP-binding protein [Anaerolineales bacterium]
MTTNPITRLLRPQPHKELFAALADSLSEAVLVIDGEARTILAANHAFLLLSGFTRNELEAVAPSDFFFSDEGVVALARAKASSEGKINSVPAVTRDGEQLLVDILAFPVGSPPQAILLRVGATSDRLRDEQRSLSEKEQLATLIEITEVLLESTPSALADIIQLAGKLLSAAAVGVYRVSSVGPEYELEGHLPDGFPASLPTTDLDPLDRPSQWSIGTRPDHPLQRSARSLGLKALRTSPLGTSSAWVGLLVVGWRELQDVPSDAIGLMEILANLSHARILMNMQREVVTELDDALEHSKQEQELQFEAVNDAVLALDSKLRVLRANQAASRMLGYPDNQLIGMEIQEVLVGPSDIMTTLLDVLGHQRQADRAHVTLHRRDGTPFPVNVRAVPQEDAAPTRVVLVLSDQSEQKAIEDQSETLAQRALLGEVAAIFAHEVRNPINNISTGLQLVASRLGSEHPQYESIERVRSECSRLDQLMEDVLFFARPLELKFASIDLSDFLERILTRWEPRLSLAKVRTHKNFAPQMSPVIADERTLEQVIVNLLTNAIQAMPEGGTLSISVSPIGPKDLELKIADTGPGIQQDQLDRVFDPFFTTKKTGTGLGLAISRRILNAHQGNISVESYPDAGTVFTLQLPIAQSA